ERSRPEAGQRRGTMTVEDQVMNASHARSLPRRPGAVSPRDYPRTVQDLGEFSAASPTELTVVRAHPDAAAFVGRGVIGREEREHALDLSLAPGATRPVGAGTRARAEEPDPFRLCFERDLDRIKHSRPWRRLAGKCQVYIAPEDDHLRTRLTHAVEVAQVATGIARAAGLNVTLTEAIALAHDCGHGPAGHASE